MTETPNTASKTLDHLAVAKASWDAVPGCDGTPSDIMAAAQTCALISIAESLAVLAGDLREERLRSESLRGALAQARQEAENAAGVLDAVVEILYSDKPDAHRIKAIAEAVTQ